MANTLDLSKVSFYGMGLMYLTMNPAGPVPHEIGFAAIKDAITKNQPQKTLLNGGEFYGPDNSNLAYIRDFFKEYPELREWAVISIKGAFDFSTGPVPNKDGIDKSVENVLKYIPDLDIFEPARLNKDIPFEETAAALDALVDEGKIKAFTFSEISGPTLAQITKLCKHKPVGVEVEYSIFTRDIIDNGLAEVAGELDIPIIAYSPLAMGMLTGSFKEKGDLDPKDFRLTFDRFKDEHIKSNYEIVSELKGVAEKKGCTPAQLAMAWIKYQSEKTIGGVKFPKIIPIPSCSSPKRVEENLKSVDLTDDEFETVENIMRQRAVSGGRYNEHAKKYLSI